MYLEINENSYKLIKERLESLEKLIKIYEVKPKSLDKWLSLVDKEKHIVEKNIRPYNYYSFSYFEYQCIINRLNNGQFIVQTLSFNPVTNKYKENYPFKSEPFENLENAIKYYNLTVRNILNYINKEDLEIF